MQVDTPFAVTGKGDAHPNFKRVLAEAKPEDIVTFMSVAGLPARGALRDGIASIGQFCIDTRLAFALKGDVKKGLFFRGSESLPFGSAIPPVAELADYLLTGRMPDLTPAMAAD